MPHSVPAVLCRRTGPDCDRPDRDRAFRSSLRARWLLLPATLFCAACGTRYDGPPRAEVEGLVTVDGTPLATGSIVFTPAEGNVGPEARAAVVDGRFRLERSAGPGAGPCRVAIFGRADPGYPLDDAEADAVRGRKPLPPDPIPDRYNRRSELTADLGPAGPNHVEFPLRTKTTASTR